MDETWINSNGGDQPVLVEYRGRYYIHAFDRIEKRWVYIPYMSWLTAERCQRLRYEP